MGFIELNRNIKHDFWIMLLVLLVFGKLSPWESNFTFVFDNFQTKLLDILIDVFLFYGYIILIVSVIMVVLSILAKPIKNYIANKNENINKLKILTRDYSNIFTRFRRLLIVIFTLLLSQHFNTSIATNWGSIGLFFFLVAEIFDFSLFYKPTYLTIKIKKNGSFIIKYKDEKYICDENDIYIIDFFKNNGWSRVEDYKYKNDNLLIIKK